MTKILSALAFTAVLVSSAACDVVELAAQTETGSFDRTLPVNGPVVLEVRTGSGDITIKTGPSDSVHVIGRIRAGGIFQNVSAASRISQIEKAPPIEQDGTTVRIGDTHDNPIYEDVGISYEITVPTNTQIQSRSGSGRQTIGSVSGSVSAHSGSGSIEIVGAGGDVQAQTGSGSIHARSVGGAIKARTGSGGIEMTQTGQADADVQTGSGSVRLTLGESAGFELVASTRSGGISVAQPMTTRVSSRHRLEATVRGGGARVNVRTGSGSITIR